MITSKTGLLAHQAYETIKARLLSGESGYSLSKEYGINATLLKRHCDKLQSGKADDVIHKKHHNEVVNVVDSVRTVVPVAKTEFLGVSPIDLMDELSTINAEIKELANNEKAKDNLYFLLDIKKTRAKIVQDLINVMAKLNIQREHDITESPEYTEVIGRILTALEPFPEARAAVVKAL